MIAQVDKCKCKCVIHNTYARNYSTLVSLLVWRRDENELVTFSEHSNGVPLTRVPFLACIIMATLVRLTKIAIFIFVASITQCNCLSIQINRLVAVITASLNELEVNAIYRFCEPFKIEKLLHSFIRSQFDKRQINYLLLLSIPGQMTIKLILLFYRPHSGEFYEWPVLSCGE